MKRHTHLSHSNRPERSRSTSMDGPPFCMSRRGRINPLIGFLSVAALALLSLPFINGCDRNCQFEQVQTSTTAQIHTAGNMTSVDVSGEVTETNLSPVEYFQVRDGLITSGEYPGTVFTIVSDEITLAVELGEPTSEGKMSGVAAPRFGGWGKSLSRARRGSALLYAAKDSVEYPFAPDSTQRIDVVQISPLILHLNLSFIRPDNSIITFRDDLPFSLFTEERDCD